MALKKIRGAQFTYYVPIGEDKLAIRHAKRGDEVDIPREEDVRKGEAAGMFEPEPEEEVEQESPVVENGGSMFDSHDQLVGWIRDERPSSRQVVTAAENDPEKAAKLLAAENEATGGQPRRSVVTGLNKITA